MKLTKFKRRYPLRPPRRKSANKDEVRKLGKRDGVMIIQGPPVAANESNRKVPKKQGDPGCHLWVFDSQAIPYIFERAPVADTLESGVVKHTNLTGGGDASCAGELWVDPADDNLIYINGCSGRYGPRTREQMDCTVEVFDQLGHKVRSFGWDDDANMPEKVLW